VYSRYSSASRALRILTTPARSLSSMPRLGLIRDLLFLGCAPRLDRFAVRVLQFCSSRGCGGRHEAAGACHHLRGRNPRWIPDRARLHSDRAEDRGREPAVGGGCAADRGDLGRAPERGPPPPPPRAAAPRRSRRPPRAAPAPATRRSGPTTRAPCARSTPASTRSTPSSRPARATTSRT